MISSILAFIVPDIPASVQREIKKEKLLAYEAIHSRLGGGDKPKDQAAGRDGESL